MTVKLLSSLFVDFPFKYNLERLPETPVTGLAIDSRKVEPGSLFIAMQGGMLDGHDFISKALDKGAVAVLGNKELDDLPVPVVMVGSQRSSDRPSSDAAINLINATRTAATSDIAEVMVCMFGPTSDQYGLLHRGTRVRKMHSSYRSTFRTLGDLPLGKVDQDGVSHYQAHYRPRRTDNHLNLKAVFDDRVAMIYYYPNMKPDVIDALVDKGYRGIVFFMKLKNIAIFIILFIN